MSFHVLQKGSDLGKPVLHLEPMHVGVGLDVDGVDVPAQLLGPGCEIP